MSNRAVLLGSTHACMLLHNVVVAHCYMACIKSGNFSNNGTLCKDKKTGRFGPVVLHQLKLTCYKREGDVCIQMVEYVISRHPGMAYSFQFMKALLHCSRSS